MRKLTRKNLSELAKTLPVIEKDVQSSFVGGGDGTYKNPYTLCEYQVMGSSFTKGWVEMSPDVVSYVQEDYISFFSGSDYDGSSNYEGGSDYYNFTPFGEDCYNNVLPLSTPYWEGLLNKNIIDYGELQKYVVEWWKPSCVFACFGYLDKTRDWHFYSQEYIKLGGVVRDDGGVYTDDIPFIGKLGGFEVEELRPQSAADKGFVMLQNGKTADGRSIMMGFNEGSIDHFVIVTGYKNENGALKVLYYDPIRNLSGERANGDYSTLFAVKHKEQ